MTLHRVSCTDMTKRNAVFQVRCSEQELADWKAEAVSAKLSLSDLIRDRMKNCEAPVGPVKRPRKIKVGKNVVITPEGHLAVEKPGEPCDLKMPTKPRPFPLDPSKRSACSTLGHDKYKWDGSPTGWMCRRCGEDV